ncbi:metallophosphoesterase [Waterburya agarophytonicola K14]|uniref:Metallophosphoesterase n=1 Tax=Waterburya agarophytonicola KI4 TaxID=2874699 RepID=A0A964FGZ1_9CYAN|nr:metallophosphoesterase [Waterburya agarophytonicola]MCC0178616.1 metallophosphoesterase [Waterburya agarophytonicola KI4]
MFNRQKFIQLILLSSIFSFCVTCKIGNQSISTSLKNLPDRLYIPPRQDFRIAVISDLNSQYGSTEYEPEVKQAIALMSQWQPDLVLCGGDAIAGQKASLTKSQINAMWQGFDRYIAAPLRQQQIPFGFTIGNHDGSGAIKDKTLVFAAERELAKAYWNEHQAELGLDFIDRTNFPFYYSFQQSGIFFLVWDASTHKISKQQLEWVKETLDRDLAQQAKTRIAIGHLPLYPVAAAKNKPGEYLAGAEELRSLLERNQVKVYISGHHHVYYPGKKGDLELLHAGALGQGARQLLGSDLLPYPTVTIIDIEKATSKLTYTTYNAKTWELITLEQLPPSITGEHGTILRQDLSSNNF